jgi:hypothetical protein
MLLLNTPGSTIGSLELVTNSRWPYDRQDLLMVEATVTIKKSDSSEWATVVLTVNDSPKLRMASLLNEEAGAVGYIDYPPPPYTAVEAACYSGAFYAVGRICKRMEGIQLPRAPFSIVICRAVGLLGWSTKTGLTPCAFASGIAVAYATGRPDTIDFACDPPGVNPEYKDGWYVADVATREVPEDVD